MTDRISAYAMALQSDINTERFQVVENGKLQTYWMGTVYGGGVATDAGFKFKTPEEAWDNASMFVEQCAEIVSERLIQPEQEPVAWRFRETKNKQWSISDDGYYISCKRTSGYIIEPLYTAPPQHKSLTEEDDLLIAAAPDLLEALQGLLRGIFDGPDEANAAMLIAKARDAVNKATGEK